MCVSLQTCCFYIVLNTLFVGLRRAEMCCGLLVALVCWIYAGWGRIGSHSWCSCIQTCLCVLPQPLPRFSCTSISLSAVWSPQLSSISTFTGCVQCCHSISFMALKWTRTQTCVISLLAGKDSNRPAAVLNWNAVLHVKNNSRSLVTATRPCSALLYMSLCLCWNCVASIRFVCLLSWH